MIHVSGDILDEDNMAKDKSDATAELVYNLVNVQATEEDASSDEDLDDDAMMELDKGLAAVFTEHKKNAQAKKDEKTKILKEKMLVRDFRIKVGYPQCGVL